MASVPRYVLRFKGTGAPPAASREHIRALPDAAVLDETDCMVLIDADENVAERLKGALPDWSVTPERAFSLPDPRPKLKQK